MSDKLVGIFEVINALITKVKAKAEITFTADEKRLAVVISTHIKNTQVRYSWALTKEELQSMSELSANYWVERISHDFNELHRQRVQNSTKLLDKIKVMSHT